MKSHNRPICIAWIVLSCCLLESISRAADPVEEPSVPDASAESESTSGIHCVHAALQALGKPIEFSTLLKRKYVDEMTGSSMQELSLAITDNGLQALAMSGLSRANLVAAQSPLILHVNTPEAPGDYNHWILLLGMEHGRAKVLEAPHSPELVPIADLLARWDGVGLYVADRAPSAMRLKLEAICTGENLALAVGLLVLVGLLRRAARFRRAGLTADRPNWQVAGIILAAAGGLAVAWHTLAEDGYVRNPVAVRTVIQQHRPSFLPKLSLPDLERLLKDPNVMVIDARFPRDYQTGHIPGAINLPVFTTQVERRKLLTDLPRGTHVIVYCQSEGCRFDETLGAALYAEGIENVSLFPGGIREWKEHGRPVKQQSDPNGNTIEPEPRTESNTP